jgi:SAM-dependent methyltransferase
VDPERRRELGAWYTPPALVDAVVAATLHEWRPPRDRAVRVLDPACGDGRFLLATARALAAQGFAVRLVGVDIDANAVASATRALAGLDAVVVRADALDRAGDTTGHVAARFDLVVGNPPFLSPLAARNARVASSSPSGAPYADAATQFLLLAWDLLEPAGGRVGLVLPQSVLANRDAGVARSTIAASGALRWLWWSPEPVFDAAVRTCALVAERGGLGTAVRRALGPAFAAVRPAPSPGAVWGALVADLGGVPEPGALALDGTLGDHATASAGFRDEFYGVAAAVSDGCDGPPLVTSGLIDPGVSRWGDREVRVAKRRYQAPRVDLAALTPQVRRWAERQLVPKVLVASQTKVIEAVADPAGVLLPGVPVVSVMPRAATTEELWRIAAALTNPVASAWLARTAGGSGLSANTFRVAASSLMALPWPAGSLDDAAARLRVGDVPATGRAGLEAYGVDPDSERGRSLFTWWIAAAPRRGGRVSDR